MTQIGQVSVGLALEDGQFKKGLKDAEKQTQKFAGLMKKALGGIAAGFTVKAILNGLNSTLEAFKEQDRAIKMMNTSLQNAGVYTYEYSQHLQKLSSEIQNFSNYGDEAIEKAISLGQAYSGNIKLTDELIRATVDYAAATGQDLSSAFTLVGKSIGSNTNALARYGIELKKGMTDTEKMTALEQQLGNRYDGTAKQISNASIQLKNAVGDLAKAFGSIFNPAIEATQKLLTKLANGLANNINLARAYRTEITKLSTSDAQLRYNENNERLYRLSKQHIKPKKMIEQLQKEQAQLRQQMAKEQAKSEKLNKKPAKLSDEIMGYSGGGSYKTTSSGGKSSGGAVSTAQHIKDAYEQAQEAVNNAKRAVQNAALTYGTSSEQVKTAFEQYKQANEQLTAVDDLFKIKETKTKFQELQQQIQDTKDKLQELYLTDGQKSDAFKETKNNLVQLQTQLQNMNTAITSSVGVDWKNLSDSIRSNLTSALLTPLQQGESAFDRLGKIGLNVVQMVGQAIISNLLKQITLEKTIQAIKTVGKGFSGIFGGLFGSANGNVFKNGNIVPFARGGVVNKPTIFPMANGAGLMGEAGAEAIMPLTRKNGKLGVEASGGGTVINIYNQSGASVETQRRTDGSIDVFVKRVNEALGNQRTTSGFRAAYQRENSKGVQAC